MVGRGLSLLHLFNRWETLVSSFLMLTLSFLALATTSSSVFSCWDQARWSQDIPFGHTVRDCWWPLGSPKWSSSVLEQFFGVPCFQTEVWPFHHRFVFHVLIFFSRTYWLLRNSRISFTSSCSEDSVDLLLLSITSVSLSSFSAILSRSSRDVFLLLVVILIDTNYTGKI